MKLKVINLTYISILILFALVFGVRMSAFAPIRFVCLFEPHWPDIYLVREGHIVPEDNHILILAVIVNSVGTLAGKYISSITLSDVNGYLL